MSEEYAREITRHATLRACLALGIQSAKDDSLDIIGDIVRHVIQAIAVRSRESVESAGRAHGGIQDVMPVLESMGPFDLSWKTLKDFGLDVDEKQGAGTAKWYQPFPFDVPEFPINKPATYSFDTTSLDIDRSKSKHDGDAFVPSHLPPYPNSHTYQSQQPSKKRKVEDASGDTGKRLKSAPNTKQARESLMKLENLPTASGV